MGFKAAGKNHQFFGIFVVPFSININTFLTNFHIEFRELQSDIKLTKKQTNKQINK